MCRQCGNGAVAVDELCDTCAGWLSACRGLLPEHVSSPEAVRSAAAWLVDSWGRWHSVGESRTSIGREASCDVCVLHETVSRDHAVIEVDRQGWLVRDLGSKNGTHVDDVVVRGRGRLDGGAAVRFGDVPFVFRTDRAAASATRVAVSTADANRAPSAIVLRNSDSGQQLQLIARRDDRPGVALMRASNEAPWTELELAPLEFAFLWLLATRLRDNRSSPSRADHCVATSEIARKLAFRSAYANEENVRQLVRRLRATLARADISQLIESAPPRGYLVAWSVG